MNHEIQCGICHDAKFCELGEINCCNHVFCYQCISKWSTIETKCPLCKSRFTLIRCKQIDPSFQKSNSPLGARWASNTVPGKVLKVDTVEERNQTAPILDPSVADWFESLICVICGGDQDEDRLLICDGCDVASHT